MIAIGFVNTPKILFSPDCSFKVCEKPSKFSERMQGWIDLMPSLRWIYFLYVYNDSLICYAHIFKDGFHQSNTDFTMDHGFGGCFPRSLCVVIAMQPQKSAFFHGSEANLRVNWDSGQVSKIYFTLMATIFKGSVSRDFRPPVFFMIQTHLGPW